MTETRTRVAIVDDDASVRRGLKRLLQANECTVLTYGSAEEFLEDPAGVEVNVALVDIYLPGISGIELLKRIESQKRRPAVVLMTAHGESETADALLFAGRTICLRKPFTLAQLLDAMLAA
jgi:FixJ family two-component response regulator